MLPCVCSAIDHRLTSKCGENTKVAHEAIAECVTDVLTTFWRLLWSITQKTHGNMESIKPDSSVSPRGMKTHSENRTTNLYENAGKVKSVLSSARGWQPCEPESLDVGLNIAGVEKISSDNFVVAVNLEDIWFEFLMKAEFVTVETFVFCGWWFSNHFDIMSETSFTELWYRPWAVVSYT